MQASLPAGRSPPCFFFNYSDYSDQSDNSDTYLFFVKLVICSLKIRQIYKIKPPNKREITNSLTKYFSALGFSKPEYC